MHEPFESSHSIPRLLIVLCKSAQSSIFKCVCVCLHFVAILASKIPALCFCYQCKSSCWILFLLYVFSLAANVFAECKMAQYPGGPAPETHTPSPSTRTHAAVDTLVSVAAKQLSITCETTTTTTMMLAPGNDAFHLFIFQALKFSLLTDNILFLHNVFICLFVCLFYLMSLFLVLVLFLLLQMLVFIFNFRNVRFVLDVWDKVQHTCVLFIYVFIFSCFIYSKYLHSDVGKQ